MRNDIHYRPGRLDFRINNIIDPKQGIVQNPAAAILQTPDPGNLGFNLKLIGNYKTGDDINFIEIGNRNKCISTVNASFSQSRRVTTLTLNDHTVEVVGDKLSPFRILFNQNHILMAGHQLFRQMKSNLTGTGNNYSHQSTIF